MGVGGWKQTASQVGSAGRLGKRSCVLGRGEGQLFPCPRHWADVEAKEEGRVQDRYSPLRVIFCHQMGPHQKELTWGGNTLHFLTPSINANLAAVEMDIYG
jgi:hypothetical protein